MTRAFINSLKRIEKAIALKKTSKLVVLGTVHSMNTLANGAGYQAHGPMQPLTSKVQSWIAGKESNEELATHIRSVIERLEMERK